MILRAARLEERSLGGYRPPNRLVSECHSRYQRVWYGPIRSHPRDRDFGFLRVRYYFALDLIPFPFPFFESNLSRQPINAESIDPKLRSTTLAGSLGNLPWTGTGDRGRGLQVASRDKAVR